LYRTTELNNNLNESEVPSWKIIIEDIIIESGHHPQSVLLKYPFEKAGFSSVYKSKEGKVTFEIGTDLERIDENLTLF
jgi:hypothetical protein